MSTSRTAENPGRKSKVLSLGPDNPNFCLMRSVSTWRRRERGPAVQSGTHGTFNSWAISAANQKNASLMIQVIIALPVSSTATSMACLKFPGVALRKFSTGSKGFPENT
uniref:Flavonoid 3-O-glucosyltransferase isoform X2 n=1 Tax=Rhizophora mucronata TaxID=61149 RepID=A0A2P2QWN4_RHIMU